jgi:murein DD-endopeptidase MepM/ murein hydrolase activator NlpD
LTLPAGATPPKRLAHRVTALFAAAPGGPSDLTVTGGEAAPSKRRPVVIGAPLAGERYIAADSCCDSTRHVRAALPINGRIRLAQRYAVDWEQIDHQGRIYAGPKETLRSYAIYGKEALAVADARVVSTQDGLPEQIPGQFPTNIPIEQADGNAVVLDLGDGNYALFAHLQPGSLRVKAGDRVARGQVLGLVGNSGNSIAPHLHFHVMDGPSPLDANGLPYQIDAFTVSGHTPGTAAFDEAEANGTPLAITPLVPPLGVRNALPMDQALIRFSR